MSESVESVDTVELFTDGACKGNPGPGGWGALLVCKGVEKELWGGEANTTNNRMELLGAIRGLEALKRPCEVLLVTDSQYVMKGINEWMANWKKRGWKTAAKEPVICGKSWMSRSTATRSPGNGCVGTLVITVTSGRTSWPTVGWMKCAVTNRPDSLRCTVVPPIASRLTPTIGCISL